MMTILAIIGLGGLEDDIGTWGHWLNVLTPERDLFSWILIILAILLFLSSFEKCQSLVKGIFSGGTPETGLSPIRVADREEVPPFEQDLPDIDHTSVPPVSLAFDYEFDSRLTHITHKKRPFVVRNESSQSIYEVKIEPIEARRVPNLKAEFKNINQVPAGGSVNIFPILEGNIGPVFQGDFGRIIIKDREQLSIGQEDSLVYPVRLTFKDYNNQYYVAHFEVVFLVVRKRTETKFVGAGKLSDLRVDQPSSYPSKLVLRWERFPESKVPEKYKRFKRHTWVRLKKISGKEGYSSGELAFDFPSDADFLTNVPREENGKKVRSVPEQVYVDSQMGDLGRETIELYNKGKALLFVLENSGEMDRLEAVREEIEEWFKETRSTIEKRKSSATADLIFEPKNGKLLKERANKAIEKLGKLIMGASRYLNIHKAPLTLESGQIVDPGEEVFSDSFASGEKDQLERLELIKKL